MERKENYSAELQDVLHYMENDLAREELPAPIVTPEYFVLAVFQMEDCKIHRRLASFVASESMDVLHNTFYEFLRKRALSVIKPGREIKESQRMKTVMENAEEISKELKCDEVTSEHAFLAILKDESSENIFKGLLNKVGISYSIIRELIMHQGDEIENTTNIEPDDSPMIITTKSSMNHGSRFTIISSPFNFPGLSNSNSDDMGPDDDVPGMGGKKGDPIKDFCINLNEQAKRGLIDELVGREKETSEIIRLLGRRKKNNVILVGGEGVGKTAIAENLAYKIIKGDVPYFLKNKIVVSLDMTALISGTTLRGMFEGRVKSLLKAIKDNGNYILMIDNIGAALADKGKNDYDISSMLSNSLENGEVQVIGTADFKSYRSTFDKDPSLSRKFGKIIVEAPTKDDSYDIVRTLKKYYEDFHKVTYTDASLTACVDLANRYITERNLPDSAIDLMDEAGAMVSTSVNYPIEIEEIAVTIKFNRNRIDALREKNKQEEAEALLKETMALGEKYKLAMKEFEQQRETNRPEINEESILTIVSEKTGIPVNKLTNDDKKRILEMADRLKTEVIGQNEPIDTICKALKRNRVGLTNGKCLYSAMLIGRTGVGKTLIAKKLAKEMFGNEKALIRFDMSEYPDKTAVNKLIGSNPGYVGYEEGGQLTEAVKNHKHCVLLLDEIEKADPEVYNIFLQVLDEGFLTDNSGMKVDFKNVIVLFTSNVGAKAANEFGKGIGFNEKEDENSQRILTKQLKNKFPPEFLNRLDNVLYFNNLDDDDLRKIISLEINKLVKKVSELGYQLEYDENTVDYLLNIVKEQKEFGARPITRAVQDEIGDKITDLLLENEYMKNYIFKTSCFSQSGVMVA